MATKSRRGFRRAGSANREDMAGAAIYLASRAGDYVVGSTIVVDGGIVYANPGLSGGGWELPEASAM